MASFDDPAFYGDTWADIYDEVAGTLDPGSAVDFLAELAHDGRALELAIGTGRSASRCRWLPGESLSKGMDASARMVDQLRAKEGGAAIPVVVGDMAAVEVDGRFTLVYLVYNSLFHLRSQDRQAECFQNVARVLEPGGVFVIECFMPEATRFDRGQHAQTLAVTEDSVRIRFAVDNPAEQHRKVQIVTLSKGGIDLRPIAYRYAWPSELDLMAAQAGLTLRERFGGWDRRSFGADSLQHISVYRK